MAKFKDPLSEASFHSAEQGIGGFDSVHGGLGSAYAPGGARVGNPKTSGGGMGISKGPMSPGRMSSVKKAGAASAAKRKMNKGAKQPSLLDIAASLSPKMPGK